MALTTVRALINALTAQNVDQEAEIHIRVDDSGHGFDIEGCWIDRIRLAINDDDPGDMTAPVEIVVLTP